MPKIITRISSGDGYSGNERYVDHVSLGSRVIDINNPDFHQRNVPVQSSEPEEAESELAPVVSHTFDPEEGYIVEGEDEAVLAKAGMNKGQREKILERRFKPLSEEELERYIYKHNLEHMGPAERDAYMRFSDLYL